MINKRLINTGAEAAPAAFDPLQNFETVTYTGNGGTQKITGYIRKGGAFNGLQTSSASYIDISSSTTSTTSSVSFWMNTTTKDSNDGTMFDAGGGSSANSGFVISRTPTNGYLSVNFTHGTAGHNQTFTGTTNICDGNWHHISLVMESDNTFVCYLDGASHLSGTRTYWTSGDTHNLSNNRLGTNAGSVGASSYEGKIDQVRIFNKALSSGEVTTLYGETYASSTKSTTDIFGDSSGVALYQLDEDANDTGGVNGYIGSGGIFNGSSSYIDLGDSLMNNYESNNFSFSCWFNLPSTVINANPDIANNPINLSQNCIFTKADYISGAGLYGFIYGIENGEFAIAQGTSSYDGYSAKTSGASLSADIWHHVVITKTSSNVYNVYIDGSLQTLSVSSAANGTFTTNANSRSAYIMHMAAATYGDPARYTEGKIDQVRIFNKALSSSEVTTLSNETAASSTKSTTDIFDDGSGVALYELEGNANSSNFGQGAKFVAGTSEIYNSYTTNDSNLTWSAWIKFETLPSSFADAHIIHKGYYNSSTDTEYLHLRYEDYTDQFTFGVRKNSTYNLQATSGITATTGVWYHVAATLDSSGNAQIYVNGVAGTGITSAPAQTNSDPITIGGANSNAPSKGTYIIDDVRIYSSVLTSTEIGYIYNNISIPTANLLAHYKLDGDATDETGSYNGTETSVTYSAGVYGGTATNVTYAYSGTPTNVNFLGMAFQPDFVWIKQRSSPAEPHALFDSVRGANQSLWSDSTTYERDWTAFSTLNSFDSNGFTLGGDSTQRVNFNGNSYVAWCWKAGGAAVSNTDGTITSQVSANQDAGFSIVKYTGGANQNQTVGHGLSSAPELIIIKGITTAEEWWVYANGQNGRLDSNNAFFNGVDSNGGIGTPTSTLISLLQGSNVNLNNVASSGNSFIAYCFHSVDGYQKIGSYTGTGAANTQSITVGFNPRFLLIKDYVGGGSWWIQDSIRGDDKWLKANTPDIETSVSYVDFTSTGFNVTGGLNDNSVGSKFIYLAIA